MNERRHLTTMVWEMGPGTPLRRSTSRSAASRGHWRRRAHSHSYDQVLGVTSMLVMASILTATDTFRRR